MSYWKFGGGYSYRTPRSKKTGWSKTLAGVPATAKKKATGSTTKKSQKSSPKTTKKRRKTRMAKKKTKKSSGFKLPGNVGPKAILTGVLGLTVVPRFIPVTSPGAKMLGTGLALRALKLGGGGALSGAGIIMLAAEFLAPYIGTYAGGGGAAAGSGGYDY